MKPLFGFGFQRTSMVEFMLKSVFYGRILIIFLLKLKVYEKSKKNKKVYNFFELYERFISDSRRGKRLQPNGKRLSPGSVDNYVYSGNVLRQFVETKNFDLRIQPIRNHNQRELKSEKNYWKKFYKQFTDYLYNDRGGYDNYVGSNIKNIKTFFNYLNKELSLGVGEFHKLFYVRKEEIAIFPLLPEELNFLILNKEFEASLSSRMKQVKDIFVFGCTVALRVSDLLALKPSNIRTVNEQYYLAVRSGKTATNTLIKLPLYAVEIVKKYVRVRKRLLPLVTKSNFNNSIRELLELAGFTQPVSKTREKRGKAVEIFSQKPGQGKTFRFCDLATTHTMRRTAITTMLSLGMSETVVRKISGHAPGSKEFYRYVLLAQTYQDQETEMVFEKLITKQLLGFAK